QPGGGAVPGVRRAAAVRRPEHDGRSDGPGDGGPTAAAVAEPGCARAAGGAGPPTAGQEARRLAANRSRGGGAGAGDIRRGGGRGDNGRWGRWARPAGGAGAKEVR